jgi:hypothetical protein
MKSIKLIQNYPFASCPSLCDLEDDKHNIDWCYGPSDPSYRLYVIGNVFGTVCGVWSDCEQNALDLAVDEGFMNCFQTEEPEDEGEDVCRLGNAGEPFDLSDCWIGVADSTSFDSSFWYQLGEAKGSGSSLLYC